MGGKAKARCVDYEAGGVGGKESFFFLHQREEV